MNKNGKLNLKLRDSKDCSIQSRVIDLTKCHLYFHAPNQNFEEIVQDKRFSK